METCSKPHLQSQNKIGLLRAFATIDMATFPCKQILGLIYICGLNLAPVSVVTFFFLRKGLAVARILFLLLKILFSPNLLPFPLDA